MEFDVAQRTCSVDGCDKPRGYSNGWCPMHYQRWKSHGSLDKPIPKPKAPPPSCSAEDCNEPARAKGLCGRHYRRQWHEANALRMYERQVARRNANREEYLAASRAYYEANRDHILTRMAEAYAADPRPKREAASAWRRANPLRRNEAEMRRRAMKRATQTEPVNYAAILEEHGMFCHICSLVIVDESDLHFDHVVPLALGGTHTRDNIKPAHALCNIRKGGRAA